VITSSFRKNTKTPRPKAGRLLLKPFAALSNIPRNLPLLYGKALRFAFLNF